MLFRSNQKKEIEKLILIKDKYIILLENVRSIEKERDDFKKQLDILVNKMQNIN